MGYDQSAGGNRTNVSSMSTVRCNVARFTSDFDRSIGRLSVTSHKEDPELLLYGMTCRGGPLSIHCADCNLREPVTDHGEARNAPHLPFGILGFLWADSTNFMASCTFFNLASSFSRSRASALSMWLASRRASATVLMRRPLRSLQRANS